MERVDGRGDGRGVEMGRGGGVVLPCESFPSRLQSQVTLSGE